MILNNAITNAIENNRKNGQAYISILSYREKNAYMIEVENSFEGEIKVNEDSELPETHKKNKKEHGFGLIHIKKVAQKYYGDIMIEQVPVLLHGVAGHGGVARRQLELHCLGAGQLGHTHGIGGAGASL